MAAGCSGKVAKCPSETNKEREDRKQQDAQDMCTCGAQGMCSTEL